MSHDQAGYSPHLKDAPNASDVLAGDRVRVAARLARSEHVVGFFFAAAGALSKWMFP